MKYVIFAIAILVTLAVVDADPQGVTLAVA